LLRYSDGAEEAMLEKRIGEPCPTCATPLQRRRSTFRTIAGDVAFCARCCTSYELADEQDEVLLEPELAPA
jgi:hypothetical protein